MLPRKRRDNDWGDGPGCIEKDIMFWAVLGTLFAMVRHPRAMFRYIFLGEE